MGSVRGASVREKNITTLVQEKRLEKSADFIGKLHDFCVESGGLPESREQGNL